MSGVGSSRPLGSVGQANSNWLLVVGVWRGTMIKAYIGDAKVWMRVALELHGPNAKAFAEGKLGLRVYPHANQLNVAAVCAGYAFELVIKALIRGGLKEPTDGHMPRDVLKQMSPCLQNRVRSMIVAHGWVRPDHFICFLREDFCHKDRKYWNRPKEGGPAKGQAIFEGPHSIPGLAPLFADLAELALGLADQEDWPGLARIR